MSFYVTFWLSLLKWLKINASKNITAALWRRERMPRGKNMGVSDKDFMDINRFHTASTGVTVASFSAWILMVGEHRSLEYTCCWSVFYGGGVSPSRVNAEWLLYGQSVSALLSIKTDTTNTIKTCGLIWVHCLFLIHFGIIMTHWNLKWKYLEWNISKIKYKKHIFLYN